MAEQPSVDAMTKQLQEKEQQLEEKEKQLERLKEKTKTFVTEQKAKSAETVKENQNLKMKLDRAKEYVQKKMKDAQDMLES